MSSDLVTHFVAQPFRRFYDLRGEVIQKSVLYDNVSALRKELRDGSVEQVNQSEDEFKRLCEAQGVRSPAALAASLNSRLN
jgi:hypothetical protein